METKRGLIVDAFRHCGIHPLSNTVRLEEFQISKSFSTASEHVMTSTRNESTSVILKRIMPSPKNHFFQ
jgi:hypothetical protein